MNLKLFSILFFISFGVSAQFSGRLPSYSVANIQLKTDTNVYDATRSWVMTMIGLGDSGRVSTTGGDKMYGTYQLWGKLDADSIRTRKIHAGGNLNYLKTDSVNALRLIGKTRVWKDIAIDGLALPSGPNAAAFTTGFAGSSLLGANYFQGATQDDIAYFKIQINHDGAPADSLDIHAHLAPTTTPAAGDTAVFRLTYAMADYGSAYPAASTTTIKVPLGGKAQWEHMVVTLLFTANGSGSLPSAVYVCSLQRLANSHASDNYTHNMALLSLDAHGLVDRMGSNNRLTN